MTQQCSSYSSAVSSSHGQFVIDCSGRILQVDDESGELPNVTRFDVAEWEKYWGRKLDDSLDILDLGYWYDDKGTERYEEPAHDWRLEIKQGLLGDRRGNVEG